MRDEEYYILFLEGLLRLPALPEAERIRPAYKLEMARRTVRTTATDFSLYRPPRQPPHAARHAGQAPPAPVLRPRLFPLLADSRRLHTSEVIAGLIANKELSVLAVYTEGDRRLWNDTKASLPREWSVAIDESRIVERELYALPAMPVIYLLDGQKTVLLKDPSPMQLEAFLDGGNGLQ